MSSSSSSSLSCEITIQRAKNIEPCKSHTNLFVRYYLSSTPNKRVSLNTHEIPSNSSNPIWNSTFSLQCQGTKDSINSLKQDTVVFELRSRSSNKAFQIGGSKLLGRGDIPWKEVLESPNMEFEKWVVMVDKKKSGFDGVKPPSVKIVMRVRGHESEEIVKKKRNNKRYEECGCCSHSSCRCEDYDVFALTAALEVL